MNTFSLKVIASDKVFFDGKCGIIIVPALDGEQAIMSHHEDMVIATKEGEVRFKEKEDDDWTKAVVGVGCVYISHNRVIMLVDTAERPEDIDRVRAEAALERAKEQRDTGRKLLPGNSYFSNGMTQKACNGSCDTSY